jgi:F0F1-type ATP synthase membrane subunit c/vacuolar-type H+-ATPase subunit K
MSDKLDMDQLRKKEFAKRTRWLVLVESLVILGLLIWVSIEYENNVFLRDWANANAGPVSFLLNGTLAGLYAGTLFGYLMAKYLGKRTEEEEILESLKKKSIK